MKKSKFNMVLGALLVLFVVWKGILYFCFFCGVYPGTVNYANAITGNAAFYQENPLYHITARNLDRNLWGVNDVTRKQLVCDGVVLFVLVLLCAINRQKNLKQG